MPLEPGTRLGPYEIQSSLGAGGMGEVYRARDHRLERDVAVKVLPTHFKPGSRQLKQFEHEARLLASLNHPAICAIYDVGSERGVSFMVMEHLVGETLGERITRGSVSVNVALRYAIQIAEALHAAHGAGLVHRDIKPSNIMLTTMGVKLLDFGLAKRHMAAAAPSARSGVATAPIDTAAQDGIVGTLHYMAPEQLSGGAIDARSDIWAFGCVIYEMVAGRRAFTGKTLTEVIAAIVADRPPVMTIEHGVAPIALEHLVSKCLAHDPADRWQTVADLAKELRSMLPHAKVDTTTPASTSGSPRSASLRVPSGALPVKPEGEAAAAPAPERRRGARVWIAAGGVLLLIAAPAGWMVKKRLAIGPAHVVAVLPLTNAAGGADYDDLAEGLADGIAADLARMPAVRAIPPRVAQHYKALDPRKAGESLHVDRVVAGRLSVGAGRLEVDARLVDVGSGAEVWRGHFSKPLAEAPTLQREMTVEVSRQLGVQAEEGELPASTIPSQLGADAYRLLTRGRAAAARGDERSLRSALSAFTDAAAKDARLAAAFAGVAISETSLAHFSLAAARPSDAYPQAKTAAIKALELDPSLADARVALGVAKALYDHDWQGAGAELDRAVALQPLDPAAHQARSEWLMALGRAEEAIAEARTAVRLDQRSASASLTLGWQLFLARRFPEAVEQLKAAAALNGGPAARSALGIAYVESGQFDEGLAELKAAAAAAPGRGVYAAALAYGNARAHHTAEATQGMERLRATAGRDYVSPYDIALVALALDDYPRAFDALQLAVTDHAAATGMLSADPRFDALRSDARFKDLTKRAGL